jgi:diguanylate cyclase (GGDEF)-like protein/PAS domain S-box-containing protein
VFARNEAFLRAVVDSVSEEIAVIDGEGSIVMVNQAWRRFSIENGLEPGQPAPRTGVGANYLAVCAACARLDTQCGYDALEGIRAVLDSRLPGFSMEYACHSPDGQRWFSMRATPLDFDGTLGAVIAHVDITRIKQAEQALVRSEERFRSFMDALPAAAFITDEDGGTLYVNRYGVDLLGLQGWVGKSPRDIFPAELAEKMIADNRRSVETGNVVAEELIPGIDGRSRLYQTHKFRIRRDGQPPLLGGIALDITERKQMEDQIRRLAFYDQLTSLPNRRLLGDRLSQAMGAGKRSGCYGALMFIDLDKFKALNDSHGHEVGDLLLTVAAERLRSCVREMDTVARFGGDEFVVMIGELDADKAASAAQAGVVAEKLRVALAETYTLRILNEGIPETTVEYRCTASIGVVLFLGHEVGQDHVINCADRAMYLAKEAGCNSVRFHEAGPH